MKFTIITPTYKRDGDVLRRCLASVNGQTYTEWEHLVIIDDATHEGHVSNETLALYMNPKRRFITVGYNARDWANTPRQIGIENTSGDYVVFLDDDNLLFPDALEQYARFFEENSEKTMAICKIIHCGPLPPKRGAPPQILDGNPPVLQNIDTLQVCLWSPIVKKHGWLNKGYMADGYTIENWAAHGSYGYLEKLLGVHL